LFNVSAYLGGTATLDIDISGFLAANEFNKGEELVFLAGAPSTTERVGHYGDSVTLDSPNLVFKAAADTEVNASVLLEVTAVNVPNGTVTFRATSSVLAADGTVSNYVQNNLVFSKDGTPKTLNDATQLGFAFDYGLGSTADLTKILVGHKVVYNVVASTAKSNTLMTIEGTQNQDWDYKWDTGVTEHPLQYTLDASKAAGRDIHFRNFYLNSNNGTVYEGNIILTLGDTFKALPLGSNPLNLASFEAAYIGQTAKSDVQLRDINKFWNTQGVFLLNDPQTITISQGDGQNTSITLYSTDTMSELQKKLNDAIAGGLGQAKYAVSNASQYVSFVEKGKEYPNTAESVAGTLVIRSMVAGNNGKLSFSGEEDLINALSLNVVQQAKENSFSVSVYDAHNSTIIASDVKVSGNLLVGVIHPNVDVEFDPMANIKVKWNEYTRSFALTKENLSYETILHLVDHSTVFQVGANEGEDVAVDIGNMSADALRVTRVILTDRESAARAITILDTAINKVSTQRAKIGAFQNSLEHTVNNLTTTATNLTDAESRIRDADMSLEMLNFTRLQILSQSGIAMLAQANQLPQSVLSLIRG
jgi:flagellin